MTSRTLRCITPLLFCALLALGACGGGSSTPLPDGQAFNLVLYADPETGRAPLTVSFFAVPSNGVEPYTYAWDFNGDGVTDSNAPNGFFTYTATSIARLTVTDGRGLSVSTTRSIVIIPGSVTPPPVGLDVRFTAEPGFGTVPYNVQFTAFVSGGTPPYEYAWDFENDGVFDNFTSNPLFTFTRIGTKVADNQYLHFPVLRVTDNRGVTGTNLDDNNNDGNPDFRIAINALPPGGGTTVTATANPSTGQAPLTVEFSGAVSGGSGNFQYSWEFGDNTTSEFLATSITTHTYLAAGTYLARVRIRDAATGEEAVSQPVTVNATGAQQLTINISSDTTQGQVPFVANLTANPINGKEPIQYTWDIFDDLTPADPAPTVSAPGNPPSLNGNAVVTPDVTQRKNPTIHFANTAGTNAAYSFVARCVATDAQGNTAVSNLVRIVANPNQTYPYYFAERPDVVGTSRFTGGSSLPSFAPVTPAPWSPRANAAVTQHPTGITYIFGGEVLDENGNFQGLVNRGNAHYMYIPEPAGMGGPAAVGTIDIAGGQVAGTAIPGLAGNMIRLNDAGSPAFPGQADRNPPPVPSQRGAPPTIVGSAASVFIHEPVESNPAGAYAGAHGQMPQQYPYPDDPDSAFDAGPGGLGSPIIYVLGGRTGANTAATTTDQQGVTRGLVQKYYATNYGEDLMPPDDVTFSFQTTGNQGDTWSPFFLRPDTDQYPDPNAQPQIQARQGAGGNNAVLPSLPVPLYGLAAVAIETGVHSPPPAFPNGPYRYVFTFGGIDPNGAVLDEMRFWNTANGDDGQGGQDGPDPGVFSLMPPMPRERAYAKAVVIPTDGLVRAPAIALIGGYDSNGAPIREIDIFQFNNPLNPSTGAWSTFNGTLPEALVGCGAGAADPSVSGGEDWVFAFGGWTGTRFSSATFSARLSGGGIVVREPLQVVPRRNIGSAQSGAPMLDLPNGFNRYYLLGGTDENGADSVVEVFGLP